MRWQSVEATLLWVAHTLLHFSIHLGSLSDLSKLATKQMNWSFFIRSQIAFAILLIFANTGCRSSAPAGIVNIPAQKSSDLVAWLSLNQAPEGLKQAPEQIFQICDELASRREVDFLLASLDKVHDEEARTMLVSSVLYQIDDLKIRNAFAVRLNDKETEESYYVANYLAKNGDLAALATLNRHYYQYPVSSWQWSYTVVLFGKYKYYPAASNLVESLDAASLNVSASACGALQKIFPNSPKKFKGPTEAKNYFLNRLSEGQIN